MKQAQTFDYIWCNTNEKMGQSPRVCYASIEFREKLFDRLAGKINLNKLKTGEIKIKKFSTN